MNDLAARVRELRGHFGLSQQALAEALGAKNKQTISEIERGRQKSFTYSQIDAILEKYGVSKSWLILGEGTMFGAKQAIVRAKELNANPKGLVSIPYFADTYASAGGGAINYDAVATPLYFEPEFLRTRFGVANTQHIHIINAIGDSMHPTIQSGDMLFVNPVENEGVVITGGIYVINFDGEVLVKRIERNPKTKSMILRSDNTIYAPITIEKDELDVCRVIGRVVGHFVKH